VPGNRVPREVVVGHRPVWKLFSDSGWCKPSTEQVARRLPRPNRYLASYQYRSMATASVSSLTEGSSNISRNQRTDAIMFRGTKVNCASPLVLVFQDFESD
jgi:hypothetical protein